MVIRNYLPIFLLVGTIAVFTPVSLANQFDPFAASETKSDSSTLEFLAEASEVPSGEPFHVLMKMTHPPKWHS